MNYRMDISYDGTKFNGWQRQSSTDNTVQGKIENTLSKYFEKNIKITGAGRTDAGVHANMQVVNFKVDKEADTGMLRRELNHFLPESIVINNVQTADERFHSRFNAVKKVYKYSIWKYDAKYPPLFNRKYVYCYDKVIDENKLKEISKKFIGKHDFNGFSSDKTKKGTIRTIESIDFFSDEFKIEIQITGDGFLYNMVRIIVGTMLDASAGEIPIENIDKVFETKNRELAGYTVPACGLFLEKIYY